jgi:hypothetical protein
VTLLIIVVTWVAAVALSRTGEFFDSAQFGDASTSPGCACSAGSRW